MRERPRRTEWQRRAGVYRGRSDRGNGPTSTPERVARGTCARPLAGPDDDRDLL